uniref:Uncharacterized protein n=1 Tax=Podoviridae sp. ct8Lf7 TaxID=2827723 RepID=A0A8S5S071_9CAUD|nr:MAG TPA: hypothetical protein [Podoviridae sp. ct8Lf7]
MYLLSFLELGISGFKQGIIISIPTELSRP